MNKLSKWYFSRYALPYWIVLLVDCLLIVASGIFAVYLTDGALVLVTEFWPLFRTLLCILPFFIIGMRVFHTYAGIIRFLSISDLLRISSALFMGAFLALSVTWPLEQLNYYPSFLRHITVEQRFILFISAMFSQWGFRILVRYIFDVAYRSQTLTDVFIYGVREGGISLYQSMRNAHPQKYLVKGFVSNDPMFVGHELMGISVFEAKSGLTKFMRQYSANILFVSPLQVDAFREDQELVDELMRAGIKIMMMPEEEKWDGRSGLSHELLKEVDIEDLLPRDKIEVDLDAIGQMLRERVILITGAAGSIGSEMVRQIAPFHPSRLILIDQAETPMHDIRLFMSRQYPYIGCETIVGDITNATHMEQIFSLYKPEYVFHAAAYKHVPMMEDNPAMAVQNNVYGTRVIADLAVKYGTRKFVMISTDKAVNPTNVMGCSKRICEIYCQSLNKALETDSYFSSAGESSPFKGDREGLTQFITTRFGNVLGSNGSVIPIFREQIKKGGPVTVTHPDIIRFFMLIPEACQLVLEAGTMGHGGEIFVFDMGKPVRIADLAQRMIDLSGAKNVEIRYTGLRDGEKLYEEVLNEAESTIPTVHPKIKVAKVREYPYSLALKNEQELYDLSFTYDDMAIVAKMKEIVPEYKSQHSKYETLDK